MASITDVAKQAGVSTASVSRVLAGKTVRDEVRRRVLEAVEHLQYRPNRAARTLRSSRTMTLGLIVADIQNNYFTQVVRAVEDAASQAGYAVFLCNSDEDPEKEATYLQLLRDENVAGIIMAPTGEMLKSLADDDRQSPPIVLIDRAGPRLDADAVVLDNVAAGADLTRHLLDHGRRRIAGLFTAKSVTGRERHDGFVAAHRAMGLEPAAELVRFVPRRDDGMAITAQLLSLSTPPDAILTSNGLLAAGVFRGIRQSGVRCPQDVAFATFDDTPWAPMVTPAVTVIQQPTYEIGRTATELLLSRIEQADRPRRTVKLSHQLIVRESCGCPGGIG